MLASKHVGAINKEEYNKMSVKCAFVCSLYVREDNITIDLQEVEWGHGPD
jgi:hypothetical protein